MSAAKYSELLDMAEGEERALIQLVVSIIPLRRQEVVMRRYGSKHPQAST